MMETITRLREKYQLSMRVERYLVNSEGIPEKDKELIVIHRLKIFIMYRLRN